MNVFLCTADKICDQVSDAVLDACIREDPLSRVACETCTKTGMVMIFGEITTSATVNYEQVRKGSACYHNMERILLFERIFDL